MRRSLFAAGLALCASCQSPTDANPFLTVIEVTPATLQLGDTMLVRVTMKNTSVATRTTGGDGCFPHFLVRTPQGAVVGPEPVICTLMQNSVTVQPGESLVFERRWAGQGRAGLLTPGAYRMTPLDGARGNSVEISIASSFQ